MYTGIILHIAAKVIFVLSSYAIHYFLGNNMSAASYGTVGALIAILDFEYITLNNGVRQAVSSALSENRYDSADAVKKGFAVQMTLTGLIICLAILFAGPIASALGEEKLAGYVRGTAPIVLCMGALYLTFGVFNGAKAFRLETFMMILYAVLKLSVVPFALFVFSDAIRGTEAGFLFAAFVALLASLTALLIIRGRLPAREQRIAWKAFIRSSFSFSIVYIVSSIMMHIDILLVRALSADAAYAGYYTGVANFAKAPYFLLNAFAMVTLPVTTSLYAQGEKEKAGNAVRTMLESISFVVLPVVAIVTASGGTLLSAFYAQEYAAGAGALFFLVFGISFLGVAIMLNMAIPASGDKRFATGLFIALLVIHPAMCYLLTRRCSITGAGLSCFLCSGFALALSLRKASRIYGGLWSGRQGKLLASNLVLFIAVFFLDRVFAMSKLYQVAAFYVVAYLAFAAAQLIMKTVDVKEILKQLRQRA